MQKPVNVNSNRFLLFFYFIKLKKNVLNNMWEKSNLCLGWCEKGNLKPKKRALLGC